MKPKFLIVQLEKTQDFEKKKKLFEKITIQFNYYTFKTKRIGRFNWKIFHIIIIVLKLTLFYYIL